MLNLMMDLVSNLVNDWGSGDNGWGMVSDGHRGSMGNDSGGLNLGHNSGFLHNLGDYRSSVDSGDGRSSQVSSIQTETMVASAQEELRVSISSWGSITAGNTNTENSLAQIRIVDQSEYNMYLGTYKSFHFDASSCKD